jgi:hypothetical protein
MFAIHALVEFRARVLLAHSRTLRIVGWRSAAKVVAKPKIPKIKPAALSSRVGFHGSNAKAGLFGLAGQHL